MRKLRGSQCSIVLHLGDTQDVQGETIVAGDFNNSDRGPINVAAYVHDFIFSKEMPKGEIIGDISCHNLRQK